MINILILIKKTNMFRLTTFINNNVTYGGKIMIIREATLSDAFGIAKVHYL